MRTYVQSGNVVFEAASGSRQEHAAAIALRIERDLGPRVGVLVLGADDIVRVAGTNPFAAEPRRETRSGSTRPSSSARPARPTSARRRRRPTATVWEAAFGKLTMPAAEGERAAFVGTPVLATPVVYLHLPHGYGRTKLTNLYFERTLGAAATTRNWRTVRALAGLATGQ